MNDPLLSMIANLPTATSDRRLADRIRLRCHAALARQQSRPTRSRTRLWDPALAGLGVAYLTEAIRLALRLYGLR